MDIISITKSQELTALKHTLKPPANTRVNTISGGLQSWVATHLDIKQHHKSYHLLYFADTQYEHKTTYQFIDDSLKVLAQDFNTTEIVFLHLKTEPLWHLYQREKFQGNSRNAVCSRQLKQKPGKLLEKTLNLGGYPITFGFGPFERERLNYVLRSRPNAKAPLIDALEGKDKVLWDKQELSKFVRSKGLKIPYLYDIGLSHNNCSGFCIKAGAGHFKKLLKQDPVLYSQHEKNQESLIELLQPEKREKVGFITVQRGVKKYRLTLKEFRKWVERGEPVDPYDMGSCSCFSQLDIFNL